MKACFIGIGSIAQRHIRNLREILKCRGEELYIDAVRTGTGKVSSEQLGLRHVYRDVAEIPEGYDAVFITNPTSLHYATLLQAKEKSRYFFIEKPVFQTGEEDTQIFELQQNVYYVACPLRYTRTIEYVRTQISPADVYSVRCISSSYLPEWRPGTDYRYTYSADKTLGGGVEIDLIHEWDYIAYLFGMPDRVMNISLKVSELEINSNDIAVYIAQYSDKTVELHLDYFGRKPMRKMTLFMREDTVEADLLAGRVSYLKENRTIDLSEDRDTYQKRELEYFLDILDGKRPNPNDINTACRLLRLTRGTLAGK